GGDTAALAGSAAGLALLAGAGTYVIRRRTTTAHRSS
ncbi:LPXTG cell wall anchor domain-containing protein, partial [Streptomyces sp. SID3212]